MKNTNELTPASPTVLQIFFAFLALGFTAFGGPIAHLGYYRAEFVDRRGWISAQEYQDLVALCQFLPGPASSQTAMGIGMLHRRMWGGFAAWLGFTLPATAIMVALGLGVTQFDTLLEARLVHGLKLAAVAIIAAALWQMGRTACTDATRIAFAGTACAIMLFTNLVWLQIAVIAFAALAGRLLLKAALPPKDSTPRKTFSRRTAMAAMGILLILLILLPVAAELSGNGDIALVSTFFRVGSLVFGGGHVVLPLLEAEVVPPGWTDTDTFLAGYGAAQAIPGPVFAFAGYLGAVMAPAISGLPGWLAGLIAVAAIFAPSFLLLAATLPHWQSLRSRAPLRAALSGVNAAVVGLLLAAFIDPVWTSSVKIPSDLAVVGVAAALLLWKRVPVWLIVLLTAAAGALLAPAA